MTKSALNRRAVFFDRDGVLAVPVMRDGGPCSARTLEEFRLAEGAVEAVRCLAAADFSIFVITNQPDIARGNISAGLVEQMHQKLLTVLGEDKIKKIYVCPHQDQDRCLCRKPKPGMILQAAAEWGIQPSRSFVVGDTVRDIEAGKAAGCKTILMDSPYNIHVTADYRVKSLCEAAGKILSGNS